MVHTLNLVGVAATLVSVALGAANEPCTQHQLTAAGMYGPASAKVQLLKEPLGDNVTILENGGHAWCTLTMTEWNAHAETRLNHPTNRKRQDAGKSCVGYVCDNSQACEDMGCVQGCATWFTTGGGEASTDEGMHSGCV